MYVNYTFMVLKGKLDCMFIPVANITKSASTCFPFFIWIPFFVKWSIWPVTMLDLPSRIAWKKSPSGTKHTLWSPTHKYKKGHNRNSFKNCDVHTHFSRVLLWRQMFVRKLLNFSSLFLLSNLKYISNECF